MASYVVCNFCSDQALMYGRNSARITPGKPTINIQYDHIPGKASSPAMQHLMFMTLTQSVTWMLTTGSYREPTPTSTRWQCWNHPESRQPPLLGGSAGTTQRADTHLYQVAVLKPPREPTTTSTGWQCWNHPESRQPPLLGDSTGTTQRADTHLYQVTTLELPREPTPTSTRWQCWNHPESRHPPIPGGSAGTIQRADTHLYQVAVLEPPRESTSTSTRWQCWNHSEN